MYHYIGNNPNPADKGRDDLSASPDKFDAQLGYLSKSGYQSITLDTLYAGLNNPTILPPKPIILTFDDGYVDFYLNAYPFGLSNSSVWVAAKKAGFIGGLGTWYGKSISWGNSMNMPRIKIGNWDIKTFSSRI